MTSTGTKATVHLSKTSWSTWERCQQRYYFEKVAKAAPDEEFEEGTGAHRGTAAHEAAAAILTGDGSVDPRDIAEAVLGSYGLDEHDQEGLSYQASDAAAFMRGLGGELRWVESLLSADFRGLTLWAKFDAAVVSSERGIDVVDFTFGNKRCASEEELLASNGTKIYRLVAGAKEPDRSFRPIRITEFHAPSGETITVTPSDDHVRSWFAEVQQVAEAIRAARTSGLFPTTSGPHCGWCPWRSQCPDGGLLSGPPL